MRRPLTAVAALSLVFLTAGCGTATVSGSKLEDTVSAKLTQAVGQKPDKVDCPDDLKGKVGSKTRCTLTAGSMKYGVTVTTTSVKDKTVNFSIKVDSKPKS